jgi:DNA-binding MarR family transcriptional regulator
MNETRRQFRGHLTNVDRGNAGLVQDVVDLVLQTAALLQAHFAACADACSLSVAQAAAIQHLADPLTMRELARRIGCDPSNVTGITDRLEARGLVTRHVDAADRRIKRLVLTPVGAKLREQLQFELLNRPAPITGLTEQEQEQLRDLLQRALASGAQYRGQR